MNEWKECKLGEVVTFNYGKSLPVTKRSQGDIPVYSSAGITGWHNKALVDSMGLVIGRKGTIGKVYKSTIPFFAIDTTYYVLPNHDIYNFDYIFYLLSSIGLNELNEDSAVPGLNRNTAYSQHVLIPPLPEQKAIASVLSSLDDKIDLLHRQNKTLEAMAETLFRQWFVEDADEGWEKKPLSEVTKIAIGRTPPRKEFHWFSTNSSDIKWISIKDLGIGGMYIVETAEYLTQEAVETFKIPAIPKDTVVLSFKMTVGRVAITTDEMVSNEAIAHFILEERTLFCKEYLYFFLKLFKYEILGSTSSIVTSINSTVIKEIKILIPDGETMLKFKNLTESYFNKIRRNQSQIYTLEKLRDTLLPKLMSGEVRVEYENKRGCD
ncbi:restriction endonuclease subunit S [Peptococcaceae bacterium]|nr:restriction endonuclease subunit S [Peptococcaceae bacterium]